MVCVYIYIYSGIHFLGLTSVHFLGIHRVILTTKGNIFYILASYSYLYRCQNLFVGTMNMLYLLKRFVISSCQWQMWRLIATICGGHIIE